jgi:predicted metalloprotease with PDZ domain
VRFFTIIILLTLSHLAYPDSKKEIKYTIEPIINVAKPYLHIKLEFDARDTDHTWLVLPTSWAGQKDFYKQIKNLISPNAKISNDKKPFIKGVSHKKGKVIIEYDLNQSFDGEPNTQREAYKPIIHKDYIHLIGNTALVYPEFMEKENFDISLEWKLPKKWNIANSFGENKHKQVIKNISLNAIMGALFIAGDFRIHKTILNGGEVNIALRGKWSFKDKKFKDNIYKIIKEERAFWRDYDHPYFLISMIPLHKVGNSMGGTGLTNSFALFLSNKMTLDKYNSWLISHEYFHTWNTPRLFKSIEKEGRNYWFSEGLTDFYSSLLLLRSKLWNYEDYVKHYNECLVTYYNSPVRHIKNEELAIKFWQDANVERLPYLRGNILAHNWNAMIKNEGNKINSFDNLIHDWIDSSRKKTRYIDDKYLNDKSLKYLSKGIKYDLKNYINAGRLIEVHPMSMGPCAELKVIKTGERKQGFNWEISKKEGIVTYVNPKGRAYEAGLRDGQKLISIKHDDNIETPVTVVIKENGVKRIITYPAYIGELKMIPQFIINKEILKNNPKKCYKWFESTVK